MLLLRKLANGRLLVDEKKISIAHGWLATNFTSKLDAVSEKDIDFWIEGMDKTKHVPDHYSL